MKLHKRDYTRLTPKENADWHKLQCLENEKAGGLPINPSQFRKYPKAARHFVHLFPNNYLDIVELKKERTLNVKLERFRALLDSALVSERKLIQFIREKQAYFIMASILKRNFTFGHHEAYMFPEFPLGTSHRVDYLLVGRSSDGYEFVFIELEAPRSNVTLDNGDLGKAFRSGQSQVIDWESWIEANYRMLSEIFRKYKKSGMDLPEEFIRFDRTRMHFVVVAGRRGDFKEKTYRMRRSGRQRGGPLILHYDNVLDGAEAIIGEETY